MSKIKTKKAPKVKWGNSDSDRLLKAAVNYIEKNGGTAVIVGGIEIQKWPEDQDFNYRLAIRITGLRPNKTTPDEPRKKAIRALKEKGR